jgi:hypothetical protein
MVGANGARRRRGGGLPESMPSKNPASEWRGESDEKSAVMESCFAGRVLPDPARSRACTWDKARTITPTNKSPG